MNTKQLDEMHQELADADPAEAPDLADELAKELESELEAEPEDGS